MIYWHVEKNSTCIYSQLKSCSSSEVAAMMEGLLRHCTDMEVEKNYGDSHGQSEIAFAFCYLLDYRLMPRLKAIHSQRLYRPEPGMTDAQNEYNEVIKKISNSTHVFALGDSDAGTTPSSRDRASTMRNASKPATVMRACR